MNSRTANLHIIWMIARKDLVDAVKNQFLFLSLLMPIFMWLIFRLVFPDMSSMGTMKIAVHDEGDSRLVAELRNMPRISLRSASGSARSRWSLSIWRKIGSQFSGKWIDRISSAT